MKTAKWILAIAAGAVMLLALWFVSSRPNPPFPEQLANNQSPPPGATHPFSSTAATTASGSAPMEVYDPSLPYQGGVAGYTGSASCAECHAEQHASWHRSYHRTMTQFASPATVQADFNNVTLTNDGIHFTLSRKQDELWVHMRRLASDNAGALDARMGLVTGSHHMQVFWVASGEGNTQVGFPFTWLIPEKRWVPRHSTFIRPPDTTHRSEVWNIMCSRCHATGIEPRVDPGARTVTTRAGELGISCEACHGPSHRHVQARLAAKSATIAAKPTAEVLRQEIVHPEKIDPIRASQICGFCHSMKWFDHAERWREHGFRYRPGDDLESTTPLIRPSKIDSVPGLAVFLAQNPTLLGDYFWSDGMGRVSGREYNGLIESPCFQGGKFSCLSCHSLHDSDPDDLLAAEAKGDQACIQCHTKFAEPAALNSHTHHRADSSGSQCYNCHMPHTTYGVLKAIRSHQISSPRVADDLRTGRPNACNLCHLDQSLAWTRSALAAWYRHPVPDLPAALASVPHAFRLALAGDAGQRVLLAWHLGWAPARAASASQWTTPVLGQLMDDPYAAVRCVAERSLRATGFGLAVAYDYVVEPRDRPSANSLIWTAWRQAETSPMGAETGAERNSAFGRVANENALRNEMDAWLRRRDDRPLRLRE